MLGLTKAGVALHRQVVEVADRRERGLFKDFSAGDIAALTGLLARLHDNAVEMIRLDEAAAKSARAKAPSKSRN